MTASPIQYEGDTDRGIVRQWHLTREACGLLLGSPGTLSSHGVRYPRGLQATSSRSRKG